MAVLLDPKSYSTKTGLDISTITDNKRRHVSRVRKDLDKIYIEAETKARASYLKLPYIDLYGFPIDSTHLIKLSKDEVQRARIGVFAIRNKAILLATATLGYPGQVQIIDRFKEEGYEPKIYISSELSFQKLIDNYNYVVEVKTISDDIVISQTILDRASGELSSLNNLDNLLLEVSLSEIVETLLAVAINNKASDIHFEPEKVSYNVRLRLDGVLHTFAKLPNGNQHAIETRIKMISGLKLNVDNVPQDGRFSFKVHEADVDVRVSMLPSNYGYSIVMRLLGTGDVALELPALGFTGLSQKRVMAAINKPQGMILNTGPTGSGKTTTLYTFLKHLNDGENKVITLEDPVEYKLEGVSQTQIDAAAGYTFGSGLRSILRQDPDVVMVGEIRDKETAETAVQASLTGHLVLSTIHTNDAAGAIPRLMEMGVKGFLLADSLSAVIGQRLIRRLCPYCRQEAVLDEEQKAIVLRELQAIPESSKVEIPHQLKFFTSPGCAKCNGLGYKGRIGVYEVLTITTGLRNLLSEQFPSIMQVREMAMKEGMVTMLQDGILKALDGVTDIPELFRNVS